MTTPRFPATLVARRAAEIITVSEATKRDITRILALPDDRVHVVHEAPSPQFGPPANRLALEMVRRTSRLPERFILHVGTLEPRKNLIRLLRAFAQNRRDVGAAHSLVLAGNRGWRDERIFAAIERLGLQDSVRFVGYVPDEVLVGLYRLADALVYPSLYEGFGLPVVEATTGVPQAMASTTGGLREVVDDAAEIIDPLDVESIAAGLRRTLSDGDRRAELQASGFARAAMFTWEAAATRTRQVYARAVCPERTPDDLDSPPLARDATGSKDPARRVR